MNKTKVTINSNGSVKIEGDFEIVDADSHVYGLQGRTVILCVVCRSPTNLSAMGHIKEILNTKRLPSNCLPQSLVFLQVV